MSGSERRTHGPTMLHLMLVEKDDTAGDGFGGPDRRRLEKLGLVRVEKVKGKARQFKAKPARLGRSIALNYMADLMPPYLADLASAIRVTASRVEAGFEPPAVQVELAAGPAPAAVPANVLELAVRAALGLEPGLQLTVRPPNDAEKQFAGVAGKTRLRIDVTAKEVPRPEVEQLVPEQAFWAPGWASELQRAADDLAARCANCDDWRHDGQCVR